MTCEDPICLTCALGKHDGHERKNLQDAQPDATKEFGELLNESKSTNTDFHSFQDNLTKDNLNIKENVEAYYKKLMEALLEEQKTTLTRLNDYHIANENIIKDRIKELDKFINNMSEEKSFIEQLKIKKKIKYHLKVKFKLFSNFLELGYRRYRIS